MMKTIIFTGGGSGGHVMPALTLVHELLSKHSKMKDIKLYYVGSYKGVERELVHNVDIEYKAIYTGKLRRYFSFQNFIDIFKLIAGFIQSLLFLFQKGRGEKIIFSTGGFVCVPVVIAGYLLGYKVLIHEQTTRMGLANKICSYFATKIFVSFEESLKYFPKNKTYHSGYPLRDECFSQNIKLTHFHGYKFKSIDRPILFITGGGNGSKLLNDFIFKNLSHIKNDYFIIHQVGKSFMLEALEYKSDNYLPIGLIGSEMIDLFKLSQVVISRSGAGTVCELNALAKRSIFVPLKIAQKNEQYYNALSNVKRLDSMIIDETDLKLLDFRKILLEFRDNDLKQVDKIQEICLNGKEILINELI